MLQILLDIPDRFRPHARSAVRSFVLCWGVPARIVDHAIEVDGAPQLVYTTRPGHWPDSVTVTHDERTYDPATPCGPVSSPHGEGWAPRDRAEGDLDWIGGAYRLLALLDESQVPDRLRDEVGSFHALLLPEELQRDPARPWVQEHADVLWGELTGRFPGLRDEVQPRWPGGSEMALLVTGDADAVRLGHPRELVTNMAKAVLRRDPMRLRMVVDGLKVLRRPMDDPLNQFRRWRALGDELGFRATFYLYHRPDGVKAALNDCKSSVADVPALWPELKTMAADGWEFGLHPSLHVKDTPGAFAQGREWLEGITGAPVSAIRHHYLAVDWRNPAATLADHAAAGFAHDSSLGWRDLSGFRTGSALPHRPLDPSSGEELPLLELPMTIMDGNVQTPAPTLPEDVLTRCRPILDAARAHGGALVLNWHVETAVNGYHYQGYREGLLALYRQVAPHAWVTTASGLADHWRRREAALLG